MFSEYAEEHKADLGDLMPEFFRICADCLEVVDQNEVIENHFSVPVIGAASAVWRIGEKLIQDTGTKLLGDNPNDLGRISNQLAGGAWAVASMIEASCRDGEEDLENLVLADSVGSVGSKNFRPSIDIDGMGVTKAAAAALYHAKMMRDHNSKRGGYSPPINDRTLAALIVVAVRLHAVEEAMTSEEVLGLASVVAASIMGDSSGIPPAEEAIDQMLEAAEMYGAMERNNATQEMHTKAPSGVTLH